MALHVNVVFCVIKKGWDNVEKRDLYDSERNLTGKYIYAGEHPPQDLYYLVVVIFIQNSNGMFLMQKRSKIKGGEWASTGGHPKMGESSFDGIITEVNEELGIDISLYKDKIVLFKTIKASDCFVDLYYLKADIDVNSLTLQEEEVEDDAEEKPAKKGKKKRDADMIQKLSVDKEIADMKLVMSALAEGDEDDDDDEGSSKKGKK